MTKTVSEFMDAVREALGLDPDTDPDEVVSTLARSHPGRRLTSQQRRSQPCSTPATKSNVIPGHAHAVVDGRFLPGMRDEVDVAGDGDHRRRDLEVRGGRLDLAARAGREVGVGVEGGGDDAVHVAEPAEQRGGGLLADAGDAGQAVGRVAAQRGEVGVLPGVDAVLLAHPVVGDPLVVADAAGDVEDPDVALVVDELEQVAVAGDDVDRLPGLRWRSVPITSSAS